MIGTPSPPSLSPPFNAADDGYDPTDDRLPRAPIVLKAREDRRVRAGHLWIYSNEIDTRRTPLRSIAPGQPVDVLDRSGAWLGAGYANPNSLICARIVTREPDCRLDAGLLGERLARAMALRDRLYRQPYYRLAYGESDGLPGLIVDRYGDAVAIQVTTAGMERLLGDIVAVIGDLLAPASIILRNDVGVRSLEGLELYVRDVRGTTAETIELCESGLRFHTSLRTGQKTGWYYDQRDNRRRIADLVPDRTVLDLFSYGGAWGITAAALGAREVTCVDSSQAAVDQANDNAALNGVGERVRSLREDAMDALRRFREESRTFDVVILDPPAYIKRKKDIGAGTAAYERLNRAALEILAEDGILVTCSCSFHLGRDEFARIVQKAAVRTNRSLQILFEGGQSADHPLHPAMPETRYLKALFCHALPGR